MIGPDLLTQIGDMNLDHQEVPPRQGEPEMFIALPYARDVSALTEGSSDTGAR